MILGFLGFKVVVTPYKLQLAPRQALEAVAAAAAGRAAAKQVWVGGLWGAGCMPQEPKLAVFDRYLTIGKI